MKRHLELITEGWTSDDWLYLSLIDPLQLKPPHHHWCQPSDLEIVQLTSLAEEKNEKGYNVYFTANPCCQPPSKASRSSRNDDVVGAHFCWADSDDAQASENILKFPIKPDILVETGKTPFRRLHAYYRLDARLTELKHWSELQVAIARALKSDELKDPRRIMRLAGSVSHPSNKKKARGYVAELVRILEV